MVNYSVPNSHMYVLIEPSATDDLDNPSRSFRLL